MIFFFQIESMTFQTIEFNFKINNKKECIMLTIKMPEQFNAVRDTSSIVDSGWLYIFQISKMDSRLHSKTFNNLVLPWLYVAQTASHPLQVWIKSKLSTTTLGSNDNVSLMLLIWRIFFILRFVSCRTDCLLILAQLIIEKSL